MDDWQAEWHGCFLNSPAHIYNQSFCEHGKDLPAQQRQQQQNRSKRNEWKRSSSFVWPTRNKLKTHDQFRFSRRMRIRWVPKARTRKKYISHESNFFMAHLTIRCVLLHRRPQAAVFGLPLSLTLFVFIIVTLLGKFYMIPISFLARKWAARGLGGRPYKKCLLMRYGQRLSCILNKQAYGREVISRCECEVLPLI